MTDKSNITEHSSDSLLRDLRTLIEQGRSQATAAVNSALTVTYWHVGRRINEEILCYKGQMELYLNWLNKHERQEGEEAPIGLILRKPRTRMTSSMKLDG